jgi:hypothetical protein
MAQKDAVGGTNGEWAGGKQLEITGVNFLGPRLVCSGHPESKLVVAIFVSLANPLARPLSQFMIAEQQMNLVGKLTGQSRKEVHELVGLVAPIRVAKRTVDDFLEHQVSRRVAGQLGPVEQSFEIFKVAVQVACHQHLGSLVQV